MRKETFSSAPWLILFLLTTLNCGLQAQSAITILGGDVANMTGSISFSAGQIAVKDTIAKAITVVNVTEQISEGVQQPYLDKDSTSGLTHPIRSQVTVFPNPATQYVVIACDKPDGLHYTLFSSQGTALRQGACTEKEMLDLQGLAAGNYMLVVGTRDMTEKNIYKIVKAK